VVRAKKKKDEKKELLEKILAKYNQQSEFPEEKLEEAAYSAEYKNISRGRGGGKGATNYEKLCNFSEGLIKITPSDATRKSMDSAIRFTSLRVTPTGVVSFASIAQSCRFYNFNSVFASDLNGFQAFGLMLTIMISYLLFTYPQNLANKYRIESGSDLVMSILYMTIFMKSNPNLEGALRFAANNITALLRKR